MLSTTTPGRGTALHGRGVTVILGTGIHGALRGICHGDSMIHIGPGVRRGTGHGVGAHRGVLVGDPDGIMAGDPVGDRHGLRPAWHGTVLLPPPVHSGLTHL